MDLPKVNIAIINKSTVPLGVDFVHMVNALQTQASRDFAPTWGIDCSLFIMDSISDDDYWALIFADDADVAKALGYHDKTPRGNPIGYVFVKTTIKDGEKPSVTASHELLEMLGNPNISNVVRHPQTGLVYAKEACDAVQRSSYTIDGVDVSDFQLPEWFSLSQPQSGKTSFLGTTTQPFQIARGGYMPVQKNGQWTQIFGSAEAEEAYKKSSFHVRTPKILSADTLPTLAQYREAPVMDSVLFAAQSPAFQARAAALSIDWSQLAPLIQKDGPVILDIAEELSKQGLTPAVILDTLTKLPPVFIDLRHWLNGQPFASVTVNQPNVVPVVAPNALGGGLLGPIIQKLIQQLISTQGPVIANLIVEWILKALKGGVLKPADTPTLDALGGGLLGPIIQKIIQNLIATQGPALIDMIIKLILDAIKGGGSGAPGGIDFSKIIQQLLEALLGSIFKPTPTVPTPGGVTIPTNPGSPPIIDVG